MKVLQISTYPIVRPLHGGQIRVKEIRDALVKLGHEVRSISFSELSHKDYDDEFDYMLTEAVLSKNIKTPFSNDLATALESSNSKSMRTFLDKHFCEFKPDYIFLEQPWLWPLVKKMIHEEQLSTKVVYSSQNVEYLTKLSILESNQVIDTCNVVQSIKELESDICANADVVIGCTQQDIDEFVKFGAKKSVLCPNGIASHVTTESSKELIKSLVGDRNYALFVGSAYPPNAQGFWTMLGNSMAWLKPNQMIVAVGGCSLILEDFAPIDSRMYDFVNFDRIKRLGFVESDELASLIEEADVLILPITSGGGSNLKTAEAIMSGKPVVATNKACRGYDITANLSHFDVCDDQQTFVSSVQKYLGSECRSVSDDEMKTRETVLWSSTLADLQEVFCQH